MAMKLPKPPAKEAAAILARARAAGFKPTAAAVAATYARNQTRQKATAAKAGGQTQAPKMPAPPAPSDFGQRVEYPGTGGPTTPEGANAYWNDFLTRLKAGESPAQIQESNAAKFGGTLFRGQGPEQVLSGKAYAAQVLQQYKGSPTLDNVDVRKGMDTKAWLAWLKKVGPAGYVGVNSGKRDDAEYARMIAAAQATIANMRR